MGVASADSAPSFELMSNALSLYIRLAMHKRSEVKDHQEFTEVITEILVWSDRVVIPCLEEATRYGIRHVHTHTTHAQTRWGIRHVHTHTTHADNMDARGNYFSSPIPLAPPPGFCIAASVRLYV